jgi:glycopeptide antibiotics resistance protein
MKKVNNILIVSFHLANLILISFYLYPGSLIGHIIYDDFTKQPEIVESFIIPLNHFFAFVFLSTLGILAYRNNNKINILINYLFLISIILELIHIVIPLRAFEVQDLLGNILGTVLIVGIYKSKKKYV